MSRDSFTHTAIANANRTTVWEALDKPETWEQIGGVDRVTDSIIDDDGHLRGFTFESVAAGISYKGQASPNDREELSSVAWNIETSELLGITRVVLNDAGGGTQITVNLEVESVGMLSSLFFPVIAAAIGNGLPEAVEKFADTFNQTS